MFLFLYPVPWFGDGGFRNESEGGREKRRREKGREREKGERGGSYRVKY